MLGIYETTINIWHKADRVFATGQCPLSGEKRTSLPHRKMSAYDPKRISRTQTFTLHNDGFSGFHWRIYLALRGGLRRCAQDWQSVALSGTIYGLARKCPVFRIRIPQANRFGRWHDLVYRN